MKKYSLIKRLIYKGGGLNNLKDYYDINNSTILLPSFDIRLDNPVLNRVYLQIGKDCVINGQFIFESSEGSIKIGHHCHIGQSKLISRSMIEIGNNVTIAWDCTIYDHDSHSLNYMDRRQDIDLELEDIRNGRSMTSNKDWSTVNSKPIHVEDDVWIGMNCIILKGVTIGRGAIVGAGSVVTKDVQPWTVVAGNPARIVKRIGDTENTIIDIL